MLFEHALLLIAIPLVFIVIGFIKNNSSMAICGGIGMLVVGVLVLASPISVQHLDNRTMTYTYDNVTTGSGWGWQQNYTVEQYAYADSPLPANDNMFLGLMLVFVGLLSLVVGAVSR